MIQTDKLLKDLQEQLHKTSDEQTKILLNEIIGNIVSGRYNVSIW